MAYREVTVEEIKEVLRRWLSGEAIRSICRQGVADRKTARRYIAAARECGLNSGDAAEALSAELLCAVVAKLQPTRERVHGGGWERCVAEREFISQRLKSGLRLT